MSKAFTTENLVSTFPYAMTADEEQVALATATAEELTKLFNDNRFLALYNRIDELDETLCDILAYDYKIDWFYYDGSVESKREQIKSHFEIHRHLGTRGAVERALSDVCPGTYVEEWFEYGGDPYYFRVIIDVTNQLAAIRQSALERMLKIFKSTRSILEPNRITLRSRENILVCLKCNYAIFVVRQCGTYPKAAVQGQIYNSVIEATGLGNFYGYQIAHTGNVKTGTIPSQATQGKVIDTIIEAVLNTQETVYANAKTGEISTGTIPSTVYEGDISGETIAVDSLGADTEITVVQSGIVPNIASEGNIEGGNINLGSTGISTSYNARYCGTPFGLL